mmetsp:Transcript_43991/g.124257  ORF Transcript_43991/g.124257 Transcript_43991/m.124257 type:complete len:380 (+) Transcript_43991:3337-4476(+)
MGAVLGHLRRRADVAIAHRQGGGERVRPRGDGGVHGAQGLQRRGAVRAERGLRLRELVRVERLLGEVRRRAAEAPVHRHEGPGQRLLLRGPLGGDPALPHHLGLGGLARALHVLGLLAARQQLGLLRRGARALPLPPCGERGRAVLRLGRRAEVGLHGMRRAGQRHPWAAHERAERGLRLPGGARLPPRGLRLGRARGREEAPAQGLRPRLGRLGDVRGERARQGLQGLRAEPGLHGADGGGVVGPHEVQGEQLRHRRRRSGESHGGDRGAGGQGGGVDLRGYLRGGPRLRGQRRLLLQDVPLLGPRVLHRGVPGQPLRRHARPHRLQAQRLELVGPLRRHLRGRAADPLARGGHRARLWGLDVQRRLVADTALLRAGL